MSKWLKIGLFGVLAWWLCGSLFADDGDVSLPSGVKIEEYQIYVDYGTPMVYAVEKAKLDIVHQLFNNKEFPQERRGSEEVYLKLINFGREITGSEARDEIGKMKLRITSALELISLAGQHPEVQRRLPIFCLSYPDKKAIPFLFKNGKEQRLAWIMYGDLSYKYPADAWFLAAKW